MKEGEENCIFSYMLSEEGDIAVWLFSTDSTRLWFTGGYATPRITDGVDKPSGGGKGMPGQEAGVTVWVGAIMAREKPSDWLQVSTGKDTQRKLKIHQYQWFSYMSNKFQSGEIPGFFFSPHVIQQT